MTVLLKTLVIIRNLSDLLEVPTTKTFTVNFNKQMQLPNLPGAIELVKLGGDKIEFSTSLSNDGKQIIVTPNAALTPGAQYVLLIHPKIQDIDGNKLKNGYYLKVSVQSNE